MNHYLIAHGETYAVARWHADYEANYKIWYWRTGGVDCPTPAIAVSVWLAAPAPEIGVDDFVQFRLTYGEGAQVEGIAGEAHVSRIEGDRLGLAVTDWCSWGREVRPEECQR